MYNVSIDQIGLKTSLKIGLMYWIQMEHIIFPLK